VLKCLRLRKININMDCPFKIGDLVAIKSSTSNEIIKNCPPGIIIEIKLGWPLSPEIYIKKRTIATILWQDGLENQVDIEWLVAC